MVKKMLGVVTHHNTEVTNFLFHIGTPTKFYLIEYFSVI